MAEEKYKRSIRIAGLRANILIQDLQNTKE
jgi:hypothetical protein